MKQPYDDIDLLDLIILLWRGKWKISIFIFLTLIIGCFYLYLNKDVIEVNPEPLYESKIDFIVNQLPPNNLDSNYTGFYDHTVTSDYQKLFYSKDVFNKWKSDNNQSQIIYENLTNTNMVNISKEERFIKIKSDKVENINEIFNYSNYVNEVLTSKYILMFENRYEQIETEFRDFNRDNQSSKSSDFIYELIKINNFLKSMENDSEFIKIKSLTNPKNLNAPKKPRPTFTYFRLVAFIVFGGMLGAVFIFVQEAILRRKGQIK